MATQFRAARITAQEALQFHAEGKPGKLEITPTKPLATQRDLSLAYSPGVAIPVQAIADDPRNAYAYTNKGTSSPSSRTARPFSVWEISGRSPPSR